MLQPSVFLAISKPSIRIAESSRCPVACRPKLIARSSSVADRQQIVLIHRACLPQASICLHFAKPARHWRLRPKNTEMNQKLALEVYASRPRNTLPLQSTKLFDVVNILFTILTSAYSIDCSPHPSKLSWVCIPGAGVTLLQFCPRNRRRIAVRWNWETQGILRRENRRLHRKMVVMVQ
jgi:hypothetical protein